MMNEHGKSDRSVVPEKPPNKAGQPAAERMEGRGLTKGNLQQQNVSGHRAGRTRLARWSEYVKQQVRIRRRGSRRFFTTSTAWKRCARPTSDLKKEAAPGMDGETWRRYGETLEDNLQDLSHRLKRGAYRAKPS